MLSPSAHSIRVLVAALALSAQVPACTAVVATPASRRATPVPIVQANNNRKPAGNLINGELELRLVVKMARWYPESTNDPYVDVAAIAEEGGQPQIPAPLIRIPTGTTVIATVRNALRDSTIYLRGLGTHPMRALDSIPVRPGETRTIRFAAGAPGTYFYVANPGIWDFDKGVEREQTGGALVVDPEGPVVPDRIFVVNIWSDHKPPPAHANALAINGKAWPFTERIFTMVGDTLHWRVVNASHRTHPMHLHGFYFRVDARGTGLADSVFTPAQRQLGVTEDMGPGNSMYMVWSPNREGNWLFHCHVTFHVVPGEAYLPRAASASHAAHSGDLGQHMSGLILGIHVRPSAHTASVRRENVRRLRLFVDEGRRRGAASRTMGYVLQTDGRVPATDSVLIPGSVIVLTKNEPSDITIVNRLPEATAIHWHGIELESYSDGVAGWSGTGDRVAPMIAPRDSFTAHLTLPRAGTFIYHTHINDVEQLTSGLYGAVVVLEPGQQFDSATDHVFVAGWDSDRDRDRPHFVINGDSTTASPIVITRGVPQRFRFINIAPAVRLFFAIRRDSTVASWRLLAKDGADLPPAVAVAAPSIRRLNVGETFDAEFIASAPGEFRLTVGPPTAQMQYSRRIIVR